MFIILLSKSVHVSNQVLHSQSNASHLVGEGREGERAERGRGQRGGEGREEGESSSQLSVCTLVAGPSPWLRRWGRFPSWWCRASGAAPAPAAHPPACGTQTLHEEECEEEEEEEEEGSVGMRVLVSQLSLTEMSSL